MLKGHMSEVKGHCQGSRVSHPWQFTSDPSHMKSLSLAWPKVKDKCHGSVTLDHLSVTLHPWSHCHWYVNIITDTWPMTSDPWSLSTGLDPLPMTFDHRPRIGDQGSVVTGQGHGSGVKEHATGVTAQESRVTGHGSKVSCHGWGITGQRLRVTCQRSRGSEGH